MINIMNTRSTGSLANDSSQNLVSNISLDIHQVTAALSTLLDSFQNENTPALNLETWNRIYKIVDSVKKCFHGAEIMVNFPVYNILLHRLRLGIADPIKEIRAVCYRTLRSLICEPTLHFVAENHFDLLIMRTLVRDARYDSEREQALRFIRAFLDHELGPSYIPISIVRVLVALAEQADDKFRHIAIETISELAVRKPEFAAYTGVFKAIFGYVFDGPKEMVEPLISTVLFLLDAHETRKYLRPQIELEMAISHFVDAYTSKGAFSPEKLQTSASVIKHILSTWTGLICFCMDDFRAIRAIVETMGLPNDDTRIAMLRMFFELFRIPIPATGGPNTGSGDSSNDKKQNNSGFNLVSQFYAVLVMIFVDAGLMEVLVEMCQSSNIPISELSVHLLSHLLAKCSTQLPETYTIRVQSLSTLFKMASDFQDEGRRHLAMAKLGDIIDKHVDNQVSPKKCIVTLDDYSKSLANGTTVGVNPSAFDTHSSIKSLIGSRMDENQFKTLLNESEVLGVKDFSKWNWDIICELVESQLAIKTRFEDLTKNTKFVSRLLTFYRPSSHQFCGASKNGAPPKTVKVGCNLVKILASSYEGQRILIESRLFAEIEDALAQLIDPVVGALNLDMIFSRERLDLTLSSEYFKFIGALTSTADGLRLLEQMKIYSLFYQIMELRGRDDVIKHIITTLSYKHDGHPRIILGKALSVGYKQNRLFATSFLEQLFDLKCPDFFNWAIPLLVQQLYDPQYEISEKAVNILHKICKESEQGDFSGVEAIIEAKPLVSHLSEVGNVLLLDFLSVPSGFEYLRDAGYIQSELEYWFEHGILQYVTQVELSIIEGLNPPIQAKSSKKDVPAACPINLNLNGSLPAHFYGELAKTDMGCELLSRTNHISSFADMLRNYRSIETTEKGIFKLKAIIWTLANTGASPTGLAMLMPLGVVPLLLEISKLSLALSLRGTAFFGISLIGQSIVGRELLQDFGWSFEGSLCLPKVIKEYIDLPPWQFDGSWPLHQKLGFKPVHYKLEPLEDEILKCLGNLSNHILATAASKRLAVVRQQNNHLFARPELCLQAWRIATVYHYRIPTRRFIQELFDKVTFDQEALQIIDLMDGLRMVYQVDEKEMAKLNENTLKSSLALLPKDPEKAAQDKKANAKNRMSLNPVRIVKGF